MEFQLSYFKSKKKKKDKVNVLTKYVNMLHPTCQQI